MSHAEEDLLTSAQVAQRLKISRASVTRFVREGRLVPALKAPGSRGVYYFDRDEIDRYEADRTARAS